MGATHPEAGALPQVSNAELAMIPEGDAELLDDGLPDEQDEDE